MLDALGFESKIVPRAFLSEAVSSSSNASCWAWGLLANGTSNLAGERLRGRTHVRQVIITS